MEEGVVESEESKMVESQMNRRERENAMNRIIDANDGVCVEKRNLCLGCWYIKVDRWKKKKSERSQRRKKGKIYLGTK